MVVAVHSVGDGTGKANTTANVAAVLVRSGKRVGVIDSDIQWPGIPDELEASVHCVLRDGYSDPVPATVTRDGSTIRVSPRHA